MKWKKLTIIIAIISCCSLTHSYPQESQTDETQATYGTDEAITTAETEIDAETTQASYGTAETIFTGVFENIAETTQAPYGTDETEIITETTQAPYGTAEPETEIIAETTQAPYSTAESETEIITETTQGPDSTTGTIYTGVFENIAETTQAPYGTAETEIIVETTQAPYGTAESETEIIVETTQAPYGTAEPENIAETTQAPYGTAETEIIAETTQGPYVTAETETEIITETTQGPYGTTEPEIIAETTEAPYGTAETAFTAETEIIAETTQSPYGTAETTSVEPEIIPETTTEAPVTEINYNNNTVGNENETLIATDPNLIAFYLYPKQDNQSYYEELKYKERSTVEKSSYNSSNPTVFFVHGFLNNYTTKYTQSMKNAYLQNGLWKKENVIAVDWGKLSTPDNYTYSMTEPAYPSWTEMSSDLYYQAAVANAPRVGKRIAEFINFLTAEQFLAGPAAVHIIDYLDGEENGFSLGAHVSAVAGNVIKKQNGTAVKRITGLDPAGPLYQNERDQDKKLDSSDASFVDIIHTNQGQEGYYGALGHADFHPNGGGPNQPNCQNSQNAIGNAVPDTMSGSCAHNRAWQFYIKSITENLQACKCAGTGNVDFVLCRTMCREKVAFGRNCPPTARGNYYLEI